MSCTKEQRTFGWVRTGTKLYYDYYTLSDTTRDFRSLIIAGRFYEEFPGGGLGNQYLFRILDRDIKVKYDGLYGMACEDCGWGIITCMTKFEFLYAPNKPYLNQEIEEYGCGRTPLATNRIIEVNKEVTVPYGKYTCYVMLHDNGDRSYWNPDSGLIMYDRYDMNGDYIGSLKLTRIER